MKQRKRIALVAHDHMKDELMEWVDFNWEKLVQHDMICTGTTGRKVEALLLEKIGDKPGYSLEVRRLKSGPLGGDQQLGAMIAERMVDMFIFFWDPMSAQPHDVDVKALLRIAVLYNVPTASNRASADFLISSPLFEEAYQPAATDFSDYLNRKI
ncbi:MAG: methylglyoxal synthase [Bacteroidota bacterium]